jgi:hypothetical protein
MAVHRIAEKYGRCSFRLSVSITTAAIFHLLSRMFVPAIPIAPTLLSVGHASGAWPVSYAVADWM